GSTTNAASLTGLIVSSAAAATAIAATVLGRVATHYSPRRLFLLTLLGGAIICIPLALSQTTGALWTWRIVLGLLAGGSTTLAYTLGSLTIPPQIRGSGLGLLTSATLIGGAVSPLMAGTLATYDLRWVFGLDALIYAAVFMWVLLVLGRRAPLEGEAT
ncbi:MAG: MFS transporter, partial [Chloroflexi bacterium]|nr:MFS transporter [Chloroflexota bacterium]